MSSKPRKKAFVNRLARHDYQLGDPLVAGIALWGSEVKSIRLGRANLKGAFVSLKGGELWLNNLQIEALSQTKQHLGNHDSRRARKLLVTKKQLEQLAKAKDQGKTIIPLEIIANRYIKIKIAAGKGLKKYDKRQLLKQRSQAREIRRRLKA